MIAPGTNANELSSSLYTGRVIHRRMRPRHHRFAYRIFNLLLDLDEVDQLTATMRVFSRNRFNVVSFHDRDHGDGSETPLRSQIEQMTAAAGVFLGGGPIRILCLPRIFGYAFNPLSVYFCYRRSGKLACIVYEVSNTFAQRHSYVIPVDSRHADGQESIRQTCAKAFYVSPFLDMDLVYDFEIRPPDDRVSIAVAARDAAGLVLATSFSGKQRPLSDGAVIGALIAHPLLTLKVFAGIHWEALAIWIKGVKLRPRPPAPTDPFTAVVVEVE